MTTNVWGLFWQKMKTWNVEERNINKNMGNSCTITWVRMFKLSELRSCNSSLEKLLSWVLVSKIKCDILLLLSNQICVQPFLCSLSDQICNWLFHCFSFNQICGWLFFIAQEWKSWIQIWLDEISETYRINVQIQDKYQQLTYT